MGDFPWFFWGFGWFRSIRSLFGWPDLPAEQPAGVPGGPAQLQVPEGLVGQRQPAAEPRQAAGAAEQVRLLEEARPLRQPGGAHLLLICFCNVLKEVVI